MESDLYTVWNVLQVYFWVEDDKMVESANDANAKLFDFELGIYQNEDLFGVLNDWKKNAKVSDKWADLTTEDRVYVNKVLIQFHRTGVALPEASRKLIKRLQNEINDLHQEWVDNVSGDSSASDLPEDLSKVQFLATGKGAENNLAVLG